MMTTIKLGGILGKEFGWVWKLDIGKPAEAIRAIEANRPGIQKRIMELSDQGLVYRVRLAGRPIDEAELEINGGGQVVTIMPIVRGAGPVGRIVLGAALIGLAYWNPMGWVALGAKGALGTSLMFNVGASLALGGALSLLSPQAATNTSSSSSATKTSYSFGSAENVSGQGYSIPVGYGHMLVGSIAVAGGLYAEDMSAYTAINPILN